MTTATCPRWCDGHHVQGELGSVEHESAPILVQASAGGAARVTTYSSMEGAVVGEPARVWVAADTGFSPAQARELARALLTAADLAEDRTPRSL
jgi:hypothetical protein